MEPLLHVVLIFVLLVLIGVKPKIGLPASLFALIPDIDVLLSIHRWILHSVLVALAVGIPLVYFLRSTKARKFAPLALLAFVSHPVIDTFYGYTPLFWPAFDESVWVKVGLNAEFGSSVSLQGFLDVLSRPISFEEFGHLEGPLITSQGLIISAVLLIPIAYRMFGRRIRI